MDVPYNLHRRLRDQVVEQETRHWFVLLSFPREIEYIEKEEILVDQSLSGIENEIISSSSLSLVENLPQLLILIVDFHLLILQFSFH